VADPEKPRLRIVEPATPAQAADYIAERLRELVEVARHAGLPRTAYLLEMAKSEALFEKDEIERAAPADRKT
jgi:hypothetical protein